MLNIFSKQYEIAIRIVGILSSSTELISTQELQKFGLTRSYIVKIIPKLIKAKIIETKEGRKGGMKLAKPASRISYFDILQAVESPLEYPSMPENLNLLKKSILDVMTKTYLN